MKVFVTVSIFTSLVDYTPYNRWWSKMLIF